MKKTIHVQNGQNLAAILKAFPESEVHTMISTPGQDSWRVVVKIPENPPEVEAPDFLEAHPGLVREVHDRLHVQRPGARFGTPSPAFDPPADILDPEEEIPAEVVLDEPGWWTRKKCSVRGKGNLPVSCDLVPSGSSKGGWRWKCSRCGKKSQTGPPSGS